MMNQIKINKPAPFRGVFMIVALLTGIIGCGTTLGPVFSQTPLATEMGRVIVYRPSSFSASRTDAIVSIGQCNRMGVVLKVANGSFARYDTIAGRFAFRAGAFSMPSAKVFEISTGETVYFELTLGGFPLSARVKRVDQARALRMLGKLREAPATIVESSDDAC